MGLFSSSSRSTQHTYVTTQNVNQQGVQGPAISLLGDSNVITLTDHKAVDKAFDTAKYALSINDSVLNKAADVMKSTTEKALSSNLDFATKSLDSVTRSTERALSSSLDFAKSIFDKNIKSSENVLTTNRVISEMATKGAMEAIANATKDADILTSELFSKMIIGAVIIGVAFALKGAFE